MSDKYNKEDPSVLQKIQNQTGCLLLVIGVAMLAFVLTDLVGSGSSIFGSNGNSVGQIAGENISYEEFDSQFEQIKATVLQNNPGIQMNEAITQQYRQQAWDILVQSKVQELEYDKLGLDVSPAELEDLTIGNNTHPQIQQSFTDPETKQFDKIRLLRFLKEDINANPQAKANWEQFQEQFTKNLIAEKYGKIVQSSLYTTDLEARNAIKEDGQTINANVVSLAYQSIPDSTINVSDDDIESFLEDNSASYEQEASRDIEFISLSVVPSMEDSMKMLRWANESIEKFKTTTDDSAFVSLMNSETPFNPNFQIRGSFSPDVEESLFAADNGTVLGPFETNGVYTLYKILESNTDSLRSVRGSHIFFNKAGADDTKAMTDAESVLAKIRSGETTFEQEASTRNFDATRSTGGDMGYVREESMAYPKQLVDRLLTAGTNKYFIVKSDRGVHLAKATSSVSRKTIKVAVLDQALYPSTATDGEYYRKAGEFLTKLNGEKSFEEVAEEMGLTKRVASKINEKERRVAGIQNGNIIARWLFSGDTDEGEISTIMDINDNYIVAKCTKIRDAGLPTVEDARGEVELLVKNKIKAQLLLPKFEAAVAKTNNAEELAKELETVVSAVPAASFRGASLPYIGQDEVIIGNIFGTAPGKKSGIIEGNNAVAVVYVNNENEYDVPDLESKKMEINSNAAQSVVGTISEALLKKAEVKDQRYKFYD